MQIFDGFRTQIKTLRGVEEFLARGENKQLQNILWKNKEMLLNDGGK